MTGRLRRKVGQLTGSIDTDLADRLAAQVAATRRGVALARSAAVGGSDSAEMGHRIDAIEREGDDARAGLITMLSSALMTPFDREDLFRVSRSIDDVLDNLQDFVREVGLYHVSDEGFLVILDAVDECLAELAHAFAEPLGDRPTLIAHALAASKASNRVRRCYQDELAQLFGSDEVTMTLLKHRELLRRLDVVGLRLGEAADALADGAVKRG